MVADRPLYLDKSGNKVVEEGSADAASQLVGKGVMISDAEVRRLGLSLKDEKVVQDRVVQVKDLRQELADAEAEQAAFAGEAADYRAEHAVKDLPNHMEAARVALDAKVEGVRVVLAQALAAAAAEAPAPEAPKKKRKK